MAKKNPPPTKKKRTAPPTVKAVKAEFPVARSDPFDDVLEEVGGGVEEEVLRTVLDLAVDIAREGREGRRVGTLFAIGDEERVLKHSRCLILDPLAGHAKTKRHLSDPNLRETIKELSQLDGGFVVSADGYVLSATRYFDARADVVDVLLGLGGRHMAAASISKQTRAIAVAVSESSVVRVFAGGGLAAEVLPEVWLLRNFSSRIDKPRLIEHHPENIAIVSRKEER